MFETTTVTKPFYTILQELTDAAGPPGLETSVGQVMERWLTPVVDEVRRDRLGSLIAKSGTSGPRVMLASHLDEVGFMVTQIDEQGFLQFQPLGGWWGQVLPAQRVEIITRNHGKRLGIVGSKPPHMMSLQERKKGIQVKELFIDIGAESKQEVEELGVQFGDFVVPYAPFTKLPGSHRLIGKAFDNRLGCAIVVEVLRRFSQGIARPNQLYGVATVLEEVGRRGALTSTHMVQPDIALVVEVGIANDSPDLKSTHCSTKLGKGPTLVLYDAGHIAHQGLLELTREIAKEINIPFQHEVIQRGATDASNIHTQQIGVPTLSLGIPGRYIHSHSSMIDQRDAEHLIRWLIEIIQRLDSERVYSLQLDETVAL